MTKHTLEVFLNDLVLVLGYPVEARMVDFDKLLPLYLNNAVWDIDTGLMLKLGVEPVDRKSNFQPKEYYNIKYADKHVAL